MTNETPEHFDITDPKQRKLAERAIGEVGLAFILDLTDLIRLARTRGFGKIVTIIAKGEVGLFDISESRKPKRDWREWLNDDA